MPCCCDDLQVDCSCPGCATTSQGTNTAPCCYKVTFTGAATLSACAECVGECEDLNAEFWLSADYGSCSWRASVCQNQPYAICEGYYLVMEISTATPYTITLELQTITGVVKTRWEYSSAELISCRELVDQELSLTYSDGDCTYPAVAKLTSTDLTHGECKEYDVACNSCLQEVGLGIYWAWKNLILTVTGIANLDPANEPCQECPNINGIQIPLRWTSGTQTNCRWTYDTPIDFLTNPSGSAIALCATSDAACASGEDMCINSAEFDLRQVGGDLWAEVYLQRIRANPSLPQFTQTTRFLTLRQMVCMGCVEQFNGIFSVAHDCLQDMTFTGPWTIQVGGIGENACDWSSVQATVQPAETRAPVCQPRPLPCPVCYDYQPHDLVVTIPDGFSDVKPCISGGSGTVCDAAIGTFLLPFDSTFDNGCLWIYSFGNQGGLCSDVINPAPEPLVDPCCPRTVQVIIWDPPGTPVGKLQMDILLTWDWAQVKWSTLIDAETCPSRKYIPCDSFLPSALSVPFVSQGPNWPSWIGCWWDTSTAVTVELA